jgi:hypothetical protein
MMAVAAHGQMDSTVINLKNVVVTGKAGTKSVTAERTRINPSATMSSATGSVLEVLRSSSAVTIDGSVFTTRRWDISSDNPVYTLTNTSRNRSRVLWLGLTWNFHSYKPLGGTKKQEEDRSVIRLGE